MLKHLIAFSVARPWVVVGMTLLLLGLTVRSLTEMPLDVFPELNAPTVTIMTEATGFAADEVEQYVTIPIETAVNGVAGARRVRSSSAISLSIVWVEFDFGTDLYRARQLVAERLDSARENLPDTAHAELAPISGLSGEIMLIALSSPDGKATPLELRGFAEFDLRPAILAVPGISQVVAIGGALPEYAVTVSAERLREWSLTFDDVLVAVKASDSTATAGYLPDNEGRELPIRVAARVRNPAEVASTVVAMRGNTPITIGHVADVRLAAAPARGSSSVAAKPAVVISVQKAPGTNTLELTNQIDVALDQLESRLPPGAKLHRHVVRQSDFIGLSLDNLYAVLRDAAIFVAIVLLLFLLNVRTTLITLAALPVSLAVALLVLWAMGLGINVMTLGGLAVAIGELVDDAIIDVENVHRRLRENAERPPSERTTPWRVVISASNEIRSSVVFATVIIVLVFVPLLFLQGLEGRFFQPLGIAYITSILASLIVALTLTPALCKLLLARATAKDKPHKPEREGFLVRWLKRGYAPTLAFAIRFRWMLMLVAAVAIGLSLWLASTFGTQFLPSFNEGTFTVFLMAPPGTSLAESTRLATGVEQRLTEIPGVRGVVRRTGRAERDEHAEPVSSSEIDVALNPGADREAVRAGIDAILGGIPGITTMIGQPIEHRLSHVLSGTPAAIAISVYGDNLDQLRAAAKDIEAALIPLPGARDISANREVTIDTLPVEFDRHALALRGMTPAMAAEQLSQGFLGAHAGVINEGTRRYDMVVRLSDAERQTPTDVMDFWLRAPGSVPVRVREVARIGPERASNLIVHENGRRKAIVSLNVADGYNLGHLVEQVRVVVDPLVAKRGLSVHYGGQFEAQQSASRTIMTMGAGVVLVVAMLLAMAFKSWRAAMLVMVNLPLALIGGILAVYIMESGSLFQNTGALLGLGGMYRAPVLSVATLVGFVTLFGIAVRNGILLVNHYQALESEGVPRQQAVIQGSMERLVPILMTALTAMLGLLPLAMAAGEPGSELLAPLAVVVLGGLVTSTFLNLVVVPAGWQLFMGRSNGGGAPTPDDGDGLILDGDVKSNSVKHGEQA